MTARFNPNRDKGIAAIELLIVIFIIGAISAIITVPFSAFRENKILDIGVEQITSLLNEARLSTLSSKDGFQYGVHFEDDRMVLFRGTTFVEPDANNKEVDIDPILEISDIALVGGGYDVVFERLNGRTYKNGFITLNIKNDPSKSIVVKVEPTGVAGF